MISVLTSHVVMPEKDGKEEEKEYKWLGKTGKPDALLGFETHITHVKMLTHTNDGSSSLPFNHIYTLLWKDLRDLNVGFLLSIPSEYLINPPLM